MMTRMRRAMAVVGMAAGLATAAGAVGLPIVKDGVPSVTIVLPAQTEFDGYLARKTAEADAYLRAHNPSTNEAALRKLLDKQVKAIQEDLKRVGDEEKLAAEELQACLRKISGAEVPIATHATDRLPDAPAILLGSAFARQAGLGRDVDALEPDGLVCRVTGRHLVLSGRRARGTLYAAYAFLESLGARWVMPGDFGELLPDARTIETAISIVENPSCSQRYWWCTYGQGDGYARWTLRNRGNFVRGLGDPVIAQSHALSWPLDWGARNLPVGIVSNVTRPTARKLPDGTLTNIDVQTSDYRLPDEYYAMSRGSPARGIPNMANPKAWDLYAQAYISKLNEAPGEAYLSISAEDGLTVDDRKETRRLDSNEFDWTLGVPSATDRMWFFHNRVIEQVIRQHPKARFGVLVYSNNTMPPRVERVHPNMALVFAPLSICPLHHVRDEKCRTNREYRKWFEAWMAQARAAGAESYYYDYDPMGFSWNLAMICPQWGIIGKNYPWFHELGLNGHTTQGHDDWAASGLNHWLMIRLYWNMKQDYHAIIEDYCRIRFGAAAPAMIEYLAILERRMDEIPDLTSNEVWGNHLILTPAVRALCRAAIAKAVSAADTPRAKAHVETMADIQKSTDAFCDAIEQARETGDFGAAMRTADASFAVADKLNKLYPYFMCPPRLARDQKAQYMTGGWYNKYATFSARITGSAASVVLPRTMKIALDTDNVAWAKGWQKPGADVSALPDGDSTLIPDVVFQTDRQPAAFFYRAEVDVPKSFAGRKRVELYFPSLIARGLQVWINGEPVGFPYENYTDATWRGPEFFWVNYDHQQSFDVTALVKPGKRNTIAFRVFKSADHGGTYDRVFLLADPPTAKP